MEMTNRRWVMLVVLSCAALAAFRLPPNGHSPWLDWEQRARTVNQATIASNLNRKIMDLDEVTTLLARRDSVLAAVHGSSGRVAPLVIASAKVSDRERQLIESAVRDQQQAIGRNGGPLALSIVSDTSGPIPKRLTYNSQRQFILPPATDGQTCITIVRLGRGRREMESEDRKGILGPCAFYAAFGPPGPGVETWLRERGYDVAADAVWPARADGNTGILVARKPSRKEELERWLDFQRSWRSMDITACSGGDRASCTRSVRSAARTYQRSPIPDGLVIQRRGWEYQSHLGPAVPTFLADLLTVYGREKFARFWRSSGELEPAFKAAFGESVGDFTMRWMRYRYGPDKRGPYIAPRSALLSVVTSLGLVGLCAAMATRRQAE